MHDKTGCKLCLSTQGNGICNAGEFPKNRRKCIRCNSTSANCPTHDNSESINQYSVYCRNITDACAVIYHGLKNISQNCATEITENDKIFCETNEKQCVFCSDVDNCNLIQSETTTPVKTTTPSPPPTTTQKPCNAVQFDLNQFLFAISIILPSIWKVDCFLVKWKLLWIFLLFIDELNFNYSDLYNFSPNKSISMISMYNL